MPDLDNRRRGRQWRELVALTLQGLGVDGAQPRVVKPRRRISEVLADEDVIRSDVLGLPGGWFVSTHADLDPRPGRLLDAAQMSARLSGHEQAAAVIYRRERPAADALTVMSLSTFASILRRAAADWDDLAAFEEWARVQQDAEV